MAYFNYRNLDPTEFEALALDVMQRRLGCKLYRYAQGTDGGIDLCNNIKKKDIVVQCKRYQQGSFKDLYGLLKREEKPKIESLNPRPKEYYVFTSLELNPQQKEKILILFQGYMEDESYIVDGIAINDFFRDKKNHDLIKRNIKLFLSFPENYEYNTAELFWLEENKLYDRLTSIFANERKDNPSIRMMDPDPNLFPKGLPEIKSDNRLAVVDKESPRSIKDMILDSWKHRDKRHILLVGEGGIGKTVAMLTLPEEEWFRQYRIPVIYVPLQRLDKREGKLDNYLKDKLGAVDYNRIIELANQRIESHPRLLLLLDGFNEIPDKFKVTTERFIRDWMEKPGVQIITTSRLGFSLENRFFKYQLQTLPIETVESFLLSAGIEKEQLPNKNDLIWKVINVPLMLALYTRFDMVKEAADRSHVAFLLDWKKADNAAHIIWNYLQTELYRYIDKAGMSYSPMQYVTAILLVAPYVCCQMSRKIKFYIDQEEMQDIIREALSFFGGRQNIVSQQFQNLRKKYDRYSEEDLFGIKMSSVYSRILVENIAVFQEQEIYDEKGNLMFTYSLMHQNFRDALAALFISLSLPKASDSSEKTLLLDYADHYVKNYIAEFLSDKELIGIWDKHREEEPWNGHITWILMDIIGRQKNYDYRTLDFSGLDLSQINLHGLISKRLDICPLPSDSKLFSNTKITFGSLSPERYSGKLNSLAFKPDGKYLASGSGDNIVRIWDLSIDKCHELEGHSDSVNSVAYSPDGRFLASGSKDHTVRIWDLIDKDLTKAKCYELKGHSDSVTSVAYSPDGKYLASGSDDRTVLIWDWKEKKCHISKKHTYSIGGVLFSPDGYHLAGVAGDNTILIWNLNRREKPQIINSRVDGISGAAYSPDGRYLSCSMRGGSVWIYDVDDHEHLVLNVYIDKIESIVYSPDGRQIACGYKNGAMVIWDVESKEIRLLQERYILMLNHSTISPDGKYLACGAEDRSVRVWNLENNKCLVLIGHRGPIKCISYSPDGSLLASSSADETIRIWKLGNGEYQTLKGYREGRIVFSPDGMQLTCGSDDCDVRTWDLKTGLNETIVDSIYQIRSVAYSPNGTQLALGSIEGNVQLFGLCKDEVAQYLMDLDMHSKSIECLEYNTNGGYLASGSQDNTVCVWNLEYGNYQALEGQSGCKFVSFSPDGEHLASVDEFNIVRVWEIKNNKEKLLKKWIFDEDVSITYCVDGKLLASSTKGNIIRVWNINLDHRRMTNAYLVIPNVNLCGANFKRAIMDDKDRESFKMAGANT